MSRAVIGVRAAKNLRAWGAYAATRYAMKNGALKEFAAACEFERRRAAK